MTQQLLLQELTSSLPLAALLFGAIMLGVYGERWRARKRPRNWRQWRPPRVKAESPHLKLVPQPAAPIWDATQQLRDVMDAHFTRRRLLNNGEARVFAALERAVAEEAPQWRVMAQVSLGEILASPNEQSFKAINSKRVDFLLVDGDSIPLHAIEFQGKGHHHGSAAARDAVKREALRRADIGYVEVLPGDTPSELRGLIAKLAVRHSVL